MTTGIDGDGAARPGWLETLLTLALVVPTGSVAVLLGLELDLAGDPARRRVLAVGLAAGAPVLLLLLAGLDDRLAGRRGGRAVPAVAGFLLAVTLVAVPLVARLGLGQRLTGSGSDPVARDWALPDAGRIGLGLAAGVAVGLGFLAVGLICARGGASGVAAGAVLAVGAGLATVPISIYGVALTYDIAVGPNDDVFADTAQTLAMTWLVGAPMAACLGGLALGRRRRYER